MDLNRSNMKKLLRLIAFAGVCLAAAMRLEAVGSLLKGTVGMFSPFIVGAAIAFILNVPMRFFERVLFRHFEIEQRIVEIEKDVFDHDGPFKKRFGCREESPRI